MTTEIAKRNHLWKPGVSGNPSGKPKGTRNKATVLAEKLLSADIKAVSNVVVEKAKNGNLEACKVILDRILPVPKSRRTVFSMAEIASTDDISRAYAGLWAAVSQGHLTPDEAVALSAVLKDHASALETKDLEARIAALERAGAELNEI